LEAGGEVADGKIHPVCVIAQAHLIDMMVSG